MFFSLTILTSKYRIDRWSFKKVEFKAQALMVTRYTLTHSDGAGDSCQCSTAEAGHHGYLLGNLEVDVLRLA